MIKFTWEIKKEKYIYWTAEWNGIHDDRFKKSAESIENTNPFFRTVDFEQEKDMAKHFGEEFDPKSVNKVGDWVAKNPVTISICESIDKLLKGEEFSTGNTDEYWYLMRLFGILSELWD